MHNHRSSRGQVFLAVCALLIIAGLLIAEKAGSSIHVNTTAEARAALDRIGNRSGTVVLERGRYGKLVVGPRSRHARWLTIRGEGAIVKDIVVRRATRVNLAGLRVTNYWNADARVYVRRSSRVRLEGLTVFAKPGRVARVRVEQSRLVRVTGSDFSNCGERTICLQLPRTSDVRVIGNVFHDCFACDFLAVNRVDRLTIRGNTFDRALPSSCPTGVCWHQDLIQVLGGTAILIEGNRFGLQKGGAAQLYISGQYPTDGVTVRGNVFLRDDPAVPDITSNTGIIVGNPPGYNGLPTNVLIEGNDVQSGTPRLTQGHWTGVSNSLIVSDGYAVWPLEQRPVVVGNRFAALSHPELICATAQVGPEQGC